LHGANLWPSGPEGVALRTAVEEYMRFMEHLGQVILGYIVSSLGISQADFRADFADPTILFRIFNYPAHSLDITMTDSLGVGEHTDYGYITILYQDHSGGLQIKSSDGSWVDVPPVRL
jgi:isopenicillin N synthase-like dioxygenase